MDISLIIITIMALLIFGVGIYLTFSLLKAAIQSRKSGKK